MRRQRIYLTHGQAAQLTPYKDRVQCAAVLGSPGMLVAQISWDQEGRFYMTPAFLAHEDAQLISQKGQTA